MVRIRRVGPIWLLLYQPSRVSKLCNFGRRMPYQACPALNNATQGPSAPFFEVTIQIRMLLGPPIKSGLSRGCETAYEKRTKPTHRGILRTNTSTSKTTSGYHNSLGPLQYQGASGETFFTAVVLVAASRTMTQECVRSLAGMEILAYFLSS